MEFDSIITFSKKQQLETPVAEVILTETESKDITKKDLKDDWLDPIVKNGIRIYTDLINLGFKIESNDPEVSTDLLIINNNSPFDSFNDVLVRDALVFGTCFSKFLFNSRGERIVGLWNMDSIRTDFFRDRQSNIKLDGSGKPFGYIEEFPFGYDINTESDESGRNGIIYIGDKKYIIQPFMFEKLPGSIEGVSHIRSCHNLVRNKWKVERGIAQASDYFGVPVWKYRIGTKERPLVTPTTMKDVKEKLKDVRRKSVIVLPWWEDVEILFPKDMGNLYKNLEPFIDQLSPGLQIPRTLLLQSGDKTSRGTFKQENRLFISRIEKQRSKVISFYYQSIFPFIANINGWKSLPKITYKPVTMEDVESFATRMNQYVTSGILTIDEVKSTVKRVEELDTGGIAND